jgi:hypothetical protein
VLSPDRENICFPLALMCMESGLSSGRKAINYMHLKKVPRKIILKLR